MRRKRIDLTAAVTIVGSLNNIRRHKLLVFWRDLSDEHSNVSTKLHITQ